MGIPTDAIVTQRFKDLAYNAAAKRGMPGLRITFTPHPVWGKTPEELRAYVDGPDPVTGKPLMQEVVDALIKPLTAEEKKTGVEQVPSGPPTFGPNTPDNLHKYFRDSGYTDFLPIVLPTEEKVEAMLKGTSHQPDEIVGRMAAGAFAPWEYTVKQVAVNAVMAGAEPEYFPVILAIASTGIASLFSSTNDFAFSVVINGPIRDKLNMNYGIGAMGPFAQPNATIGRAWTLLSRNLGNGGILGLTYLGTQGNNLNYNNVVIAENEKASPWAPLHVQRGFKPEENVASIFGGLGIVPGQGAKGSGVPYNQMFDHQFVDIFSTFTGFFGSLVIADPLVARSLKEQGYDTKEKLCDWLQKNSTQTVKEYKTRLFVGSDQSMAERGDEPYATWFKMPDDAIIPRWDRADRVNIVVAGGETNPYFQAGNLSLYRSVSIDKWM
jgi:hypothetical protein